MIFSWQDIRGGIEGGVQRVCATAQRIAEGLSHGNGAHATDVADGAARAELAAWRPLAWAQHRKPATIALACGLALALVAASAAGHKAWNAYEASAEESASLADAVQTGAAQASAALEQAAAPALARYTLEYAITAKGIAQLEISSEEATAFALDGTEAPQLSADELAAVEQATSAITGAGADLGFFFIDLSTGTGIARNADERIYGASSFKGPYAAFVTETQADVELGAAGASSGTLSLIASAVEYSDNDAFSSLRNRFDSAGFADWLASCGVEASIMNDTHFPRYSARESALLWLHTYRYLLEGTDAAQILESHFENTNLSFIRNGIAATGEEARVLNKAGWIASSARFSGTCDAGIIETEDGAYLMSIMTSQPDGATAETHVADLAQALFELRSAL